MDLKKGDAVFVTSDKLGGTERWYVLDFVDTWPDGVIVYSQTEEDVRFVPTWAVRKV